LTAVGDKMSRESRPSSFVLFQNHPNPLRDATTIRFAVHRAEQAVLEVFDLNGRLVATLLNRQINAGEHALRFTASSLPNGVYVYRLRVGGMTQQRKLVVLR
jgi:hypothetical protein